MMQDPRGIRRIAAHSVFTPQGFLKGGMLTLDAEGTVTGISAPQNLNSLPNVEFYSGMLIPGMVNAHTHLELSYLRETIPERCGFAGFAAALREQRGSFSRQQILSAIDYVDARMWADGIQAAGDIGNGGDTFEAKRKSSIAYHSFIELFGLNCGSAQATRARELRREAAGLGLRASITPHSAYSLNEEGFMLSVGDEGNSPVSIHFMESAGEAELYQDKGEMKRWYEKAGLTTDFTSRYCSPAERIIKLIPPDRKVLLVHNTLVGQQEIGMLCSHFGDNLTYVLCPLSNHYITGLTPPFGLLEKSGARIAIGTDSLASNHTISMIDEMKAIKGIPLDVLLTWATRNGAEALDIDGWAGSFEIGKRPGVVLLTGINWDDMSLTQDASTRRLA